jgi:DNA-binding winged helix-turn-helix (wHTH) protein/TolB-like protein/Flp pilus assembly protein TadD
MSKETKEILEFGRFRLNSGEVLLTRDGSPVSLPPRVFDLLVYLVSNAGRLIEKEELLKALWPDSFVEEANLTVNVAALRRALGSQPDGQPWIETVPRRGYRFSAAVSRSAESAAATRITEPVVTSPPAAPVVAPASAAPYPTRRWKYAMGAAAVPVLGILAIFLYVYGSGRGKGPNRQQTIAVLPFQELVPEVDNPHAGLAMADALITRLGALPQITVRSIATVTKYERTGLDPVEAGKALAADTVLAGSIQRLDKRIRVTVRLVRVPDGQSLWADKFDEFFTNIFAVQDAISEKLASVLALRLTSEDQDRMMQRFTENTEAFRLYELGRYGRFSDRPAALDYLQKSINEDPRYALPYVELANIYVGLSGNGAADYQKNAPLAQQAAAAALRLAPDLAESHVAAADVKRTIDRDFQGAARELDTAMRLNPGSAMVHASRSILLEMQGDSGGALQEIRTAVRFDPFNRQYAEDLAWILFCNRQYEEAVQWLDEFNSRDPRPHIDWNRFYCYMKLSRVPEAITLIEMELKAQPSSKALKAALAHAYVLAERSREAKELLKSVPENWGHYQRAVVDVALGDREAALADLDQAVDERSVWIPWLKVDPDLEPLRGDPRFAKIVARVGLLP